MSRNRNEESRLRGHLIDFVILCLIFNYLLTKLWTLVLGSRSVILKQRSTLASLRFRTYCINKGSLV